MLDLMNPPDGKRADMEPSLLLRPSIMERFDFESLFPAKQPVEVELGSGDGSFILDYAAAHPETNFLAVERLMGRLKKIDRKGRRAGLKNLLGVRLEAGYLLEWMIIPGVLDAVHIYFPDPWPKRRHWKNRLIHEEFAQSLIKALKPGGFLHLRTDDRPYFDRMLEVFDGEAVRADLTRVETSPDLLAWKTDFEKVFNEQGKPTWHASWSRRVGGGG